MTLHMKWKDCVHAVRLRLERVGVECRGVVLDVQLVQPVKLVQHETGSKADCIPLFQMAVYPPGVRLEVPPRPVEFSIVLQVMDADFEAVSDKIGAQITGSCILAFRDKVEGSTKAHPGLPFH